jgi:hypothetical protein
VIHWDVPSAAAILASKLVAIFRVTSGSPVTTECNHAGLRAAEAWGSTSAVVVTPRELK